MKLRALKFILTIFSVIYPFAIFFASCLSIWILCLLGILWAIRGFFESGNFKYICFFIAVFFMLCMIFRGTNLAFLYPVLMSLLFLAIFANSLRNEALITKIARLKEPNLDQNGVIYTRKLTKIWCVFFVINGVVAYVLSLMEDKIYWSLYSGVISYMIMGVLFGGEILYRKIVLKV
ncbi:putative membrane protein [Campylobacter sp. RM16192]|nr:putative membrane protein [Campylobacter sp. RM16192]